MGGIQPSVPGPDKDGSLRPHLPQKANRPQASDRHSSIPAPLSTEEDAGRPIRRNFLEAPRGFGEAESGAFDEASSREAATRRAIDEARRRLAETGSGTGADPWAGWRRVRAKTRSVSARLLPDVDPAYLGWPQRPASARPATTGPKPDETQVAFAPALIQGIARFGPPAIAGLQYLWQKYLEQEDRADAPAARSKPATPPPSRMRAHEPPPPTGGGMEPPERPDTTRETFPADPPKIMRGTTIPMPESGKPRILIFPDISKEIEQARISEIRRERPETKDQIDDIRDYFEEKGAKHTHGGRFKSGKERSELYIPGPGPAFKHPVTGKPGDSRPRSARPDLTFKWPDGRRFHVQTADVDKNGWPLPRELDNAERIRRATGEEVLVIPKTWQLR